MDIDDFDKQQNKALFEQAIKYMDDHNYPMCQVTLHYYAQAELSRLNNKLAALKRREQDQKQCQKKNAQHNSHALLASYGKS